MKFSLPRSRARARRVARECPARKIDAERPRRAPDVETRAHVCRYNYHCIGFAGLDVIARVIGGEIAGRDNRAGSMLALFRPGVPATTGRIRLGT